MKNFQYGHFISQMNKGTIEEKALYDFLEASGTDWYKRLSTELLMNYVAYVEMVKDKKLIGTISDNDALVSVHNELIQMLDDFEGFLGNDNIEVIIAHRKTLLNAVRAFTAYSEYAKMLEYVVNRLEKSDQPVEDDEAFCGKVISLIFEEEDNLLINDKIHGVYEQMPIRISKVKFYDLIDRATDHIKGVKETDFYNYMLYLKESFAPEHVEGFSTVKPTIASKLEAFNFEAISDQTIADYQHVLNEVAYELMDAITITTYMTTLINLMLGIKLINTDFEQVTLKSHHEKVKKAFDYIGSNKNQADVIDDLLYKMLSGLEGVIEEASEHLLHIEGVYDQIMVSDMKLTKDMISAFTAMKQCDMLTSGSLFGDLDDTEESPQADHGYIAKERHALIAFMKDQFKTDSRPMQRSRMAHLLSIMSITQESPQEIYEFLLTNFKGCQSEVEKVQSQQLILDVLDAYDFDMADMMDDMDDFEL